MTQNQGQFNSKMNSHCEKLRCYIADINAKGRATMKNSWWMKVNIHLAYNNPTPRYLTKRNENGNLQRRISHNSPKLETTQTPVNWWVDTLWTSTQWNTIRQGRGKPTDRCRGVGRISEALCYVKEARHKKLRSVWFLLHGTLESLKLYWQKTNQCLGVGVVGAGKGRGNGLKRDSGNIWGNGNILYLDGYSGHVNLCICQNLSNILL